jgi:L-histidine Nalpha-methyltransferase
MKTPPMVQAKSPRFIQAEAVAAAGAAQEIHAGLLAPLPQIAPKYFYDELGSHLFAAITQLPQYYPTRTEAAIFQRHAADMARALGPGAPAGGTLIDLGAGNCQKAARLFRAFEPAQYAAVDISVEFLRDSLDCLQRQFPQMDMVGVGTDFSQGLDLPDEVSKRRRVFFYPGSSIGNFTPHEATQFLRRLRTQMDDDGALLIGVDLVKPDDVLVPAYDDDLGVTAAFNLNMLLHVNRLAGTDFRVPQWQHVALFDAEHSRIEMHVQAREALTVRWPGGQRRFAPGERIHTENSYKYTPQTFEALLARAGYGHVQHWCDERGWFAVMLARPR